MKRLSDKVCCCLEEEHRPNLQETAWHVHILKINHDDTWGWCWLFLLLTGIFALMKTLFERQLYEHIHHEYKSGEHFDSLSSRQPLCCAPLTDSQHRNTFIFSEYLLTGRSRLPFAPRDFSTKTGSRLRGTPGCTLHGRAEAGAAQTSICAGRPAISAHFSLTPRREALAKRWRSPDTRPLASKVEASKVSIVSGSLSDFALISGVARVLNLDLLALKCLSRGNDPRRVHKPKCWLNAPLFILRHQITVAASDPAHVERSSFLPADCFLSIYIRMIQQPSLFHLFPAVKVIWLQVREEEGGREGEGWCVQKGWGRRIEGINLEGMSWRRGGPGPRPTHLPLPDWVGRSSIIIM